MGHTRTRRWVWVLMNAMMIGSVLISTSDAQETNYGPMLYRQYCASCHGEDGKGHGPMEPFLTVKPSDLTRIAARRDGDFPREQLTRIVTGDEVIDAHGTRTMPIWGEQLQVDVIGTVNKSAIARGRIGFLVDYLETLQGTGEKAFDNRIDAPPGAPIPGTTPRR
jgi:mono/diheme cytochrome c family protein